VRSEIDQSPSATYHSSEEHVPTILTSSLRLFDRRHMGCLRSTGGRVKTAFMVVGLFVAAASAYGQGFGTISGQVIAEAGGFPVARARVLVADTSTETITDAEGRFSSVL
jgi:hypothetical protein